MNITLIIKQLGNLDYDVKEARYSGLFGTFMGSKGFVYELHYLHMGYPYLEIDVLVWLQTCEI